MTTNQNLDRLTPKYTPEEIIAKLQAHPKFGSQLSLLQVQVLARLKL
jgi:hypothetical protein